MRAANHIVAFHGSTCFHHPPATPQNCFTLHLFAPFYSRGSIWPISPPVTKTATMWWKLMVVYSDWKKIGFSVCVDSPSSRFDFCEINWVVQLSYGFDSDVRFNWYVDWIGFRMNKYLGKFFCIEYWISVGEKFTEGFINVCFIDRSFNECSFMWMKTKLCFRLKFQFFLLINRNSDSFLQMNNHKFSHSFSNPHPIKKK